MALDKGETALAEVARRKAEHTDSESLGNAPFHNISNSAQSGRFALIL